MMRALDTDVARQYVIGTDIVINSIVTISTTKYFHVTLAKCSCYYCYTC